MKNIYYRLLMLLCIFCIIQNAGAQGEKRAAATAEQNAIETIKSFYSAYVTYYLNDIEDVTQNNLIKKKYLTKRLIEKIDRTENASGIDAILHSTEGVGEEILKTLEIKQLDKSWYMVSYHWSGEPNAKVPLRVNKIDGKYMIDYITPVWNDTKYGDSLFFDKPKLRSIDDSTPMQLVKTFYDAYVMEYCSMPEGLIKRLEALRATYCTPNVLAQFKTISEKDEGFDLGYDLLIGSCDFDRLWIPSMTYKRLKDGKYQMHYMLGGAFGQHFPITITLTIIRQGNKYKIDAIKVIDTK